LIREFKETRAVDENIVKLKGFKKAYYIDNSPETTNYTFEHYYDSAKRVMVKKRVIK
jgi:hypothetical protein